MLDKEKDCFRLTLDDGTVFQGIRYSLGLRLWTSDGQRVAGPILHNLKDVQSLIQGLVHIANNWNGEGD